MREDISRVLASRGLEHYPEELPDRYWDTVRLFKSGSPAGELIRAVMNPGTGEDQVIRNALASADTTTIDRIRELVCDR